MTDRTSRQRARLAAAEDTPEARAALLRDELRQGVADPGLVRWCAYAGDEVARLVDQTGIGGGWGHYVSDSQPIGRWIKRLPSLAESCSLAGVETRCPAGCERGNVLRCARHGSLDCSGLACPLEAVDCQECDGSSKVRVPVGAHWLLVRTGLEVGRACLAWLHRSRPGPGGGDAQLAAGRWLRVVRASGRALDAVQAWLDCPCEEHLRAWAALYREYTPDWVPNPVAMVRTTVESLPTYFGWQMKAAARLLPPETIRSCVLRVGREEQQRKRESV